MEQVKMKKSFPQILIWIAALGIGTALGCLNTPLLNNIFNLTAAVFTRLFQFLAAPSLTEPSVYLRFLLWPVSIYRFLL